MVEINDVFRLSDEPERGGGDRFPEDELELIKRAVEDVPPSVFLRADDGYEVGEFDEEIAESLVSYASARESQDGRKLWPEDFGHTVDLYNSDERIAIEIEKSEQKYLFKDIAKFVRGSQTVRDGRRKIEYGCLIVPIDHNTRIFDHAKRAVRFNVPVLDALGDVVLLGYTDPRG